MIPSDDKKKIDSVLRGNASAFAIVFIDNAIIKFHEIETRFKNSGFDLLQISSTLADSGQ